MNPEKTTESDDEAIKGQSKVLIIDDEKLLRQSIQRILEKAGFYCETATDYKSARKCVENLQFDVIIADIVLPKMSGIQLLQKLKEEFKLNCVLILITGEPHLETSLQAIRLGASDYLEKPFPPEKLLLSIRDAFMRKNVEIEIQSIDGPKKIILKENFIKVENNVVGEETRLILIENTEKIHQSLVDLKNNYGEKFDEDQKALLNSIAQSNSQVRKLLRNLGNTS